MASTTTFAVAVTGDTGTDTYTRYVPGYVSEVGEGFHPEIAFDLKVRSGARFHQIALHSLLKHDGVNVLDSASATPTLPQSLQFLGDYQWEKKPVIRISRSVPLKLSKPKSESEDTLTISEECPDADALVIHDATAHWRTSVKAGEFLASFFSHRPSGIAPMVFVILEDNIPELRVAKDATVMVPGIKRMGPGVKSPIWTELLKHKEDVAILLSVASLRHAGAAISRRLSWERGVQDALADLQLFQPLQSLSVFRHLFVRVGFVGAVHLQLDPESEKRFGQVVFAPSARNAIFCDETKEGQIRGQDTVIAACLLRAIRGCKDRGAELTPKDIAGALKSGLTANMTLFDRGFSCPRSHQNDVEFLEFYFRPKTEADAPTNDLLTIVTTPYDDIIAPLRIPRNRIFGTVPLPSLSSSTGKAKSWEILRSQIQEQGISRINLGIAICKFGHQEVVNRPFVEAKTGGPWSVKLEDLTDILMQPECVLSANETADDKPLDVNVRVALPHLTDYRPPHPTAKSLFVPVCEIGDLVAIERTEVESFRSIQNLMQWYVESQGQAPTSGRPISIAVFGAPGSGKSFAIKQIAKSINDATSGDSNRLETIECNVAQFRSVEDLGHAITRIASVNNQRKIPLVFFDEFECELEDQPLGWLKYFLAPMQDGTFYGASQTISFGRAIFVFAGGVYRTIAEFDPFAEPVSASHPEEMENQLKRQAAFRNQKGPDFVSRLRGHINILSLNPDETAPKDEDGKPVKPVLRRALTLRSQILQAHRFIYRDGCKVANVDNDVLYAFLTVERYRHGTRSMEAILQMCTPIDGIIEKASLPSRAQLNMHVDADDFMVRVLRGRFRRFLAPIDPQSASVGTGGMDHPTKPGGGAASGDESLETNFADRANGTPTVPYPDPTPKRRETRQHKKKNEV